MTRPQRMVSDHQLNILMTRETSHYETRTPRSKAVFEEAQASLLNGVPMPWMGDWGTAYPLFVERASENRIIDVDGNTYVDFCLGDTGAMFGHSPGATVDAVTAQLRRGITTMMPTEDALWVGKTLGDRFGPPFWQVAMTATEANRYVIRICRTLTRRPKILVYNECYHGSVDEALVHIGPDGRLELRSEYDINPGIPKDALTRVVEFNDIPALEAALASRDVACVLAEPVMTNCGMVLPAPGYHDALRDACTRHGTYLVIDETHTLSSGPGGYTAAHGLQPDFLTLGKSIAGGVPVAVYGFTAAVAEGINATFGRKGLSDPMGIGGTLSGNALAVNAMRATLDHVVTPEAFDRMIAGANRMADGLEASIAEHRLPWSVTRCGARAELQLIPHQPSTGSEAKAAFDWGMIYYTHLYLANRGFIITPFHNMMLVPPMATDDEIDRLVQAWDACMGEIADLAGI